MYNLHPSSSFHLFICLKTHVTVGLAFAVVIQNITLTGIAETVNLDPALFCSFVG